MMNVPCWLCSPDAPAIDASPGLWSLPRALCLPHKMELRLGDGRELATCVQTLRTRIQDGFGRSADLFSPAFHPSEPTRPVWIDFFGIGYAAFEDRFGARDPFEFRAMEWPPQVDFLYVLRRFTIDRDGSALCARGFQFADLADLSQLALSCLPQPPSAERGVMSGLDRLCRTDADAAALRQWREQSGCLLPATGDEFLLLHAQCQAQEPSLGLNDPAFATRLLSLSARRFPTIPVALPAN